MKLNPLSSAVQKTNTQSPFSFAEPTQTQNVQIRSISPSQDSFQFSMEDSVEFTTPSIDSTPLQLAVVHADPQVVSDLIAQGADVNQADGDGLTPLHMAASQGRQDIVEILLKEGASTTQRDQQGMTPLHIAVQCRSPEVIQTLLAREEDIHTVDAKNRTLLHLAAMNGSLTGVKELLKTNIDMDRTDDLNRTPLHYAVLSGNFLVVRTILEHSPNLLQKADKEGFTPKDYAQQSNDAKLIALFPHSEAQQAFFPVLPVPKNQETLSPSQRKRRRMDAGET